MNMLAVDILSLATATTAGLLTYITAKQQRDSLQQHIDLLAIRDQRRQHRVEQVCNENNHLRQQALSKEFTAYAKENKEYVSSLRSEVRSNNIILKALLSEYNAASFERGVKELAIQRLEFEKSALQDKMELMAKEHNLSIKLKEVEMQQLKAELMADIQVLRRELIIQNRIETPFPIQDNGSASQVGDSDGESLDLENYLLSKITLNRLGVLVFMTSHCCWNLNRS
jgi:hypothetical protein